MQPIKIGKHKIGPGNPCFLIADVAQAHDGSLGQAHAFIDAATEAGSDAIKFQTHIADAESTKDEAFRIPIKGKYKTRYEYWKAMEFSPSEWTELARHARQKNLLFLSTPFSVPAAELLKKIGMPAWKVGSGEFRSTELLDFMIKTRQPVLYSTGISRNAEVAAAIRLFQKKNVPHALFQCTSEYPTPLEHVGLNILGEYRRRYKCPVGLSDHSGSPFPSLAAIAQCADIVEVHVTFDRLMHGPDTMASVTFDEFALIREARDAFHIMGENPVDKDEMANSLKTMRGLFTKSLALTAPQKAGTVITAKMLAPKKPGTGIPYEKKTQLIGRRLKRATPSDRLLRWEDFDA
ncbi:MAG: N-acetylneuraminate synthase family protein [Alphaproteobacteria bacterium]